MSGVRSIKLLVAASLLAAAIVIALVPASGTLARGTGGDNPIKGSLSIEASRDVITFGKTVGFIGRLRSPNPLAAPVGNREVILRAQRYPYKKAPERIDSTMTKPNGTFEFSEVKPPFNTRFSVVVEEEEIVAKSTPKKVFVRAIERTRSDISEEFVGTIKFKLRYSPNMPTKLKGRRVHWYFRKVTQGKWREVDRSRTRSPRPGVLTSNAKFDAPEPPPGGYTYVVGWCIDTPRGDIGIGTPALPCKTGIFPARPSDRGFIRAAPRTTSR